MNAADDPARSSPQTPTSSGVASPCFASRRTLAGTFEARTLTAHPRALTDARPRAAFAGTGSWRSETAGRCALAVLPCIVLVLDLPSILGQRPIVPLTIAFANAFVVMSVGREVLGRRAFVALWAAYGLFWTVVAWHGLHFRAPPRPAALFLNLPEIARTPVPDPAEVPWAIVCTAIALGWMAYRPNTRDRPTRRATYAAVLLFAGIQTVAFLRFNTRDMMRLSQYTDLVHTHGLEGAAILDVVESLRAPDSSRIFRDLRVEATVHPPAPIPLDPIAPDRVVVIQLESLDLDAVTRDGTPTLFRLWNETSHAVVDPLRTSVSGSSGADFQLLTGLRPLTGVPVYRLRWSGDVSALPAFAASRSFGFHVYHGNDRNFWNRGPFLAAIGAEFHAMDAIPETEFSRWGRADGDLFRYGVDQVRRAGRAVHLFITLSLHAPYDLVDPAAHMHSATPRARYLSSVTYLDRALGQFLAALPRSGTTLVAIYSDHTSNLFASGRGGAEPPVPMMLGTLGADGSLMPLTRVGHHVTALPGTYEIPAIHRYLESCLDASAH